MNTSTRPRQDRQNEIGNGNYNATNNWAKPEKQGVPARYMENT